MKLKDKAKADSKMKCLEPATENNMDVISEENHCHVHDLAEATVVASVLKQMPKLLKENALSQRAIFVFSGDKLKIISARKKYYEDVKLPCRGLLTIYRDLKFAVRQSIFGGH